MKIDEIHFGRIDSTHTYAKANSSGFAPDRITWITAEEQTAGRGRFLGRKWHSPPGVNLYATIYFQLPQNTPHLTHLAQVLACTLRSVFEKEHFKPAIKWPNDLMLRGKKVAGVMGEVIFSEPIAEVILGLGLNVNMSQKDLAQIDQPATSLLAETGKEWDRGPLLKKLQAQFSIDLNRFKRGGLSPFPEIPPSPT